MNILIVDDEPLARDRLRTLLADLAVQLPSVVVGEAANGVQALDLLQVHTVDVVLADIRMPGMDGIAAVQALRDRHDNTPVLLLTTFDDADLLLRATEAGAQGFLLKDAAPEDLLEAIVRVAGGDTLLQPVSTAPVRARYRFHADESPPRDTFGKREVEILRLIAGGYSNREIARSLFLAEGTVKNYVSAILDKLGTRDRTRAVLKAITLRII